MSSISPSSFQQHLREVFEIWSLTTLEELYSLSADSEGYPYQTDIVSHV